MALAGRQILQVVPALELARAGLLLPRVVPLDLVQPVMAVLLLTQAVLRAQRTVSAEQSPIQVARALVQVPAGLFLTSVASVAQRVPVARLG